MRDNIKVLEEVLTTSLEGKFRLEQGATNWKEVAKIAGNFLAGEKETRKALAKVGGQVLTRMQMQSAARSKS